MFGVPLTHPGYESSLLAHFSSDHVRMVELFLLAWVGGSEIWHPPSKTCSRDLGQGKAAWEGHPGLEKAASGLW